MAYEEPDTALHHLKMAKSYMDEAQVSLEKIDQPSEFFSEMQLKSLAQAAVHLNKARAIDPTEVLWVEYEKEDVQLKLTQDYITSRVLACEGAAHLNSAGAIWTTYQDSDGKTDRNQYAAGVRHLERGRDTLLKALTYNSYSHDGLRLLQAAYFRLGDKHNCRRILERRIELEPDNLTLHKEIKELSSQLTIKPYFDKPPAISLNAALGISIAAGLIIAGIGLTTGLEPVFALGTILWFAPIAFWIGKIIWRESFG